MEDTTRACRRGVLPSLVSDIQHHTTRVSHHHTTRASPVDHIHAEGSQDPFLQDTRLHACRRECTAVLPAAWLTGGYLRLGVGYTLNGLPAAHYSARLPCARARCGVHQSMRCTCLLSTSPLTIHIHTHHLYCTKYAPVASYGCQLTRLAGRFLAERHLRGRRLAQVGGVQEARLGCTPHSR